MGRKDSTKSSKRKRDKISSKKKSRRKDRKKRRIHDSVTTNSVDDLLNSGHIPSPTLKSDHRRKINKKKKGHHDYSLSSYSDYDESLSSDSDSDHAYKGRKARRSQAGLKDAKKRKRLDRDFVKPKKKSSKKKFSKYTSSSSESHSICQSRSSGSTADGLRQVIPNKDIERLRGRGSHKEKKMHKVRTPSSSCDRGVEASISISNSDEALFPTNNSRRLRSVIVVVDQSCDEVENRWEMGPHKEEIVNDQSDFPCLISNENLAVEEAPELGKSRIDIGDLEKVGNHQLEGAHTNDSGGVILESILRQKALESLRKKFQQRLQTGPTVKKNDESDEGTVNIDQNKLIKEGGSNTQEINKTSGLSSKGELSLTEDEDKKLPDSGHFDKDPGVVKQSFAKEVKKLVECLEEDKSVNACTSSSHSLDGGNEAKDGSQFQQKTMSVMRGGEQVQVSYKVYIPKKAPALARKQLRR